MNWRTFVGVFLLACLSDNQPSEHHGQSYGSHVYIVLAPTGLCNKPSQSSDTRPHRQWLWQTDRHRPTTLHVQHLLHSDVDIICTCSRLATYKQAPKQTRLVHSESNRYQKLQEVCAQLRTSAYNVTLLAFAAVSPAAQQSIDDISCNPAAAACGGQIDGTDRRTDKRTFIDVHGLLYTVHP